MTTDFSKYQKIIDQFSGKVFDSDFEARFSAVTKNIPKTERFLLKMELKRLASPCTRLVDLRGHVDGECRPYEHESRVHFLDELAIRVFEQALNNYGSYTFGVYEAVTNTENNFRVIYQREKANVVAPTASSERIFEKVQYPAQIFHYGPYFNRSEERMNFAIALRMYLDGESAIEATSSDISVSGCKIRLTSIEDLKVGQQIQIKFTGLEGEFQFGKNDDFYYEVRNIQIIEDIQLLGVARVYSSDNQRDGFRQFLTGFIQGNKRRYKINLDNSIVAIQSRAFEQFTLPKSNELPVFIDNAKGLAVPRYALTCNNNQETFQYWQDERKNSALPFLITPERFLRLKKAKELGRNLLVYSFVHERDGRKYFYTADNIQLEEDKEFMPLYLGFAAGKPSFAVTQLSLLNVLKEFAHSPLTVANALPKKEAYRNLPPNNDVMQILAPLNHIVVATDITEPRMAAAYKTIPYEGIDTMKLKMFGHKRLSTPVKVDTVGISYRNQRQEPRYIYSTPAVIEIDKVTWSGVSKDFSTSGLKVELEKASVLNRGDIVNVSFPNLQKITSAFDLKALPYEVVRLNADKTVVNLRVYVEKHQHIGRSFFKALIEKNHDKLTTDQYEMVNPGLAKALRNLYAGVVTTPNLIVQTSGSRYKVETITGRCDRMPLISHCKELSDRTKFHNLYPLLNNIKAMNEMNSTLKKLQKGDPPVVDTLYISIKHNGEAVDKSVVTKLESELQSEKHKHMFIQRALKTGDFFCVQVKLSRTEEPDMDFLSPELSYIGSYAIHRGKQLEQEIWSVVGCVSVFDITPEALNRYKFVPHEF